MKADHHRGERTHQPMQATFETRRGSVKLIRPDIRLVLDGTGVIREAAASAACTEDTLDDWIGSSWTDTVDPIQEPTIRRIIDNALTGRLEVSYEVSQRFPSGREIPIEYTAVRAEETGGIIAIGRNVELVRDLEAKLLEAQQSSANDHLRLREAETRYRLLLEGSNDGVLLLGPDGTAIQEANSVAMHALGLDRRAFGGHETMDFRTLLSARELTALDAMLDMVREANTAPGILVHLGPDRSRWFIRATLTTSSLEQAFMLRLSPAEAELQSLGTRAIAYDLPYGISEWLVNWPHAFVVIDRAGEIEHANEAFLDMTQLSSRSSAVGASLGRWLSQPGANLKTLLISLEANGFVQSLPTVLHGELGIAADVEVSAVRLPMTRTHSIGVMLCDVSRRLRKPDDELGDIASLLTQSIGSRTLRQITGDAVGMIERQYIESALDSTGGNRTAAAETLGLSRQSLYAKLSRYGLIDEDPQAATEDDD